MRKAKKSDLLDAGAVQATGRPTGVGIVLKYVEVRPRRLGAGVGHGQPKEHQEQEHECGAGAAVSRHVSLHVCTR